MVTFKVDTDSSLTKWVCEGLKETDEWVRANVTLGIYDKNCLIAGVIYHDIRASQDCWITIYSTNKRWCSRRSLRLIFGFAFNQLKCRRINALVDTDNRSSIRLLKGVGFRKEGLLRQFRENEKDCYIFGLLKSDCKYLPCER